MLDCDPKGLVHTALSPTQAMNMERPPISPFGSFHSIKCCCREGCSGLHKKEEELWGGGGRESRHLAWNAILWHTPFERNFKISLRGRLATVGWQQNINGLLKLVDISHAKSGINGSVAQKVAAEARGDSIYWVKGSSCSGTRWDILWEDSSSPMQTEGVGQDELRGPESHAALRAVLGLTGMGLAPGMKKAMAKETGEVVNTCWRVKLRKCKEERRGT